MKFLKNNLAKRFITAFTLGPLVILLILYGAETIYAGFIGLVMIVSFFEYYGMTLGRGRMLAIVLSTAIGFSVGAGIYFTNGELTLPM